MAVLFVASVYRHLTAFHIPYLMLLRSWGYEVLVAARGNSGREQLQELGFSCVDIPFARSPYSSDNFAAFWSIRDLLSRRRDIGLIQTNTPVASFLTSLAARSVGFAGSLLHMLHGFYFQVGGPAKDWILYYPPEYLMARFTDSLICINQEDFRVAQRFRLRRGGKVYYVPGVGYDERIYNPGDPDMKRAIRDRLGLADESTFLIAYVAEINYNKNHLQLLNALRPVNDRGYNAKALVIGDGKLSETMRFEAVRLGLGGQAVFLGHRDDVPDILKACDAAALFSHREGLPRSLMEAAGTGLPLVATDIRGNRDIVRHGANGFVVPVGEYGVTSAALIQLISDEALRTNMGLESRRIAHEYSLSGVMPMMESVYRECLCVALDAQR